MRWLSAASICVLLVMLAGTANAANVGEKPGHFTVTYATGSAHGLADADLLGLLEGAYDYVNGFFGTCPDHVEVIIVDKKAMDEVGEQVDSFSAWNKLMSAIVLRQETLKNNTSLPMLVEHELTHLAINDILCKKDPREFHWMEEGICMVVSKEPLDDADVARYIAGHGFLDTGGIAAAVKDEDCSVSKNGCMQSYSLVEYIVRRHGIGAVIGMLECPEASLDQAFRQYTGEDFPAFYKEWENHVMTAAS